MGDQRREVVCLQCPFRQLFIIMAVTDPDASPYRRMSMFIVPADTPGIEIVRNYGFYGEPEDTHAHLRWTNVRVPAENMLGNRVTPLSWHRFAWVAAACTTPCAHWPRPPGPST